VKLGLNLRERIEGQEANSGKNKDHSILICYNESRIDLWPGRGTSIERKGRGWVLREPMPSWRSGGKGTGKREVKVFKALHPILSREKKDYIGLFWGSRPSE